MNKHTVFVNIAEQLSMLSKCVSMGVGCIAVNERGRIVGSGVNGTISGYANCCDIHSERGGMHPAWSQKYEIHAEMNCILELARSSSKPKSLVFYVTHSPCDNCLKHMMGLRAVGELYVNAIIYKQKYSKISEKELDIQKAYCLEFGVSLMSIDEVLKS